MYQVYCLLFISSKLPRCARRALLCSPRSPAQALREPARRPRSWLSNFRLVLSAITAGAPLRLYQTYCLSPSGSLSQMTTCLFLKKSGQKARPVQPTSCTCVNRAAFLGVFLGNICFVGKAGSPRSPANSPENRGVWRSEMALLRLRSCVAISSCWFARINFSSCRNAQQVKG